MSSYNYFSRKNSLQKSNKKNRFLMLLCFIAVFLLFAALIAEFDRCWAGRVTRTRDVLAVADEWDGRAAG